MQLSGAKEALHGLVRRLHGLLPHDRERVEAELAEILLYLIRTSNRVGIDLVAAAGKQISHDARNRPVAVADVASAVLPEVSAEDQPLRILIIEDEQIVAGGLQEVLNGFGYDAYAVASSGTEALAIARDKRPDIVLMDTRINGEIDGIETAAQLRREFDTAVIFLTAMADDATVQRAKHSDPEAYLVKPVNVTTLKTTIELTAHRQRRTVVSNGLSSALKKPLPID